jgi:hypothetical protein
MFFVAGNAVGIGHHGLVDIKTMIGLATEQLLLGQSGRLGLGGQSAIGFIGQRGVDGAFFIINDGEFKQVWQAGLFADDLLEHVHFPQGHHFFQRGHGGLLDAIHPFPLLLQFARLAAGGKLVHQRQGEMTLDEAGTEIDQQQAGDQHGEEFGRKLHELAWG